MLNQGVSTCLGTRSVARLVNPDIAFYDALAENGQSLRTFQDDLGHQGSKAHRPLYPHGRKAVRKSMALRLIDEVSERQETTLYSGRSPPLAERRQRSVELTFKAPLLVPRAGQDREVAFRTSRETPCFRRYA